MWCAGSEGSSCEDQLEAYVGVVVAIIRSDRLDLRAAVLNKCKVHALFIVSIHIERCRTIGLTL